MTCLPYKSEAHEHQFTRFRVKGQLTGVKTILSGLMKDKDNFTKAERENFGKMFCLVGDLLFNWQSTLPKEDKKCLKKR